MDQNNQFGAGGGTSDTHAVGGGTQGRSSQAPIKRQRSPRIVQGDYPVRDMMYFTISKAELTYLGFSSGIGSATLSGALYFYTRYTELIKTTPAPPSEFLSQTFSTMIFLGALAAVSYLVFGGTILKIKWESGQRGWKLFF